MKIAHWQNVMHVKCHFFDLEKTNFFKKDKLKTSSCMVS